MAFPKVRIGGAWESKPPRYVRYLAAWQGIKVLYERQLYFDGVDWAYRWNLLAVVAVPDQTPAATSMSAGVNYHTTATLALPSGDPGGWERTTWKPHVFYRNASTLDPLGDFVLAVGATSDGRTWSASLDGVQVQCSYQWETEAGAGTRSGWSSAVTIAGGL